MRVKYVEFVLPNGDVVSRQIEDPTFHPTAVRGHGTGKFWSQCSECGWESSKFNDAVAAMDAGWPHTANDDE